MRHTYRSILTALFFLFLATSDQPLRAEGGCPPGSYPIGGGNGGWQGYAPIPGGGGGGGSGGAAGPRRPVYDNWSAAAWHENASDLWIVTGFPNRTDAEQTAVKACDHSRYMGNGCKLATSYVNGAIAVAKGTSRLLYWNGDQSAKAAERGVLEFCRSKQDYCTIVRSVTAKPGKRQVMDLSPPAGNFRSKFGSAAWPVNIGSAPAQDQTVYLVGGYGTGSEAQQAALGLCRSRSGQDCKVVRTVADTFFVVFSTGDKEFIVASSPTESMASQIAKAYCPAGRKCAITAVVAASRTSTLEHRPLASKRQ